MKTFTSSIFRISAGMMLFVVSAALSSAQVAFRWIDGLQSATAVSADGSVVVGSASGGWSSQSMAARWTQSTGTVAIPPLPGVTSISFQSATAVSADGSTVIGTTYSGVGALQSRSQGYRWTAATGTVGLRSLPGKVSSTAVGVSGDGSVVVGSSESLLPGVDLYRPPEAYRWTAGTGMTSLGLGGDTTSSSSNAMGVSRDGSIIVGNSSALGGYRWTEAGGATGLGAPTYVYGVSGNGAYIVGSSGSGGFIWDEANGVQAIPNLPIVHSHGGFTSRVADDGRLILGGTYDQHDVTFAYVWTPESGPRLATDVLTNVFGLADEFSGFSRISINNFSDDGRFWVGSALGSTGTYQGWLLDLGAERPIIPPGELPPFQAVPEPSTYALFAGLLMTGVLARRVWRTRLAAQRA